jgi:hypothetical protein
MTSCEPLQQAWRLLESEVRTVDGVYQRRVHADSRFHLFAGFRHPSGLPSLLMEVQPGVSTARLERATSGFTVDCHRDPGTGRQRISLDLASRAFRDIFGTMASEIVAVVLRAADEATAVSAMRSLLDRWERFMRNAASDGLPREKRVGLYGELTFLRVLVDAGMPAEEALSCWKGPLGGNQDFVFRSGGVEVKTTTANVARSADIANEHQLDDSLCQPLFLMHLAVRIVEGAGASLPQAVAQLKRRFPDAAVVLFDDLLLEAGYHPLHEPLYQPEGYLERRRAYYIVEGAFPRIRESELRDGVYSVAYSIDLGGVGSFEVREIEVVSALCIGTERCT